MISAEEKSRILINLLNTVDSIPIDFSFVAKIKVNREEENPYLQRELGHISDIMNNDNLEFLGINMNGYDELSIYFISEDEQIFELFYETNLGEVSLYKINQV